MLTRLFFSKMSLVSSEMRRLLLIDCLFSFTQFAIIPTVILEIKNSPLITHAEGLILITVFLVLSRLGAFPSGCYIDKRKIKHVLVAAIILRSFGFFLLFAYGSFISNLMGYVFIGLSAAAIEPAVNGAIAKANEHEKALLYTLSLQALNFGLIFGSLFAGFFVAYIGTFKELCIVCSFLIAILILLVSRFKEDASAINHIYAESEANTNGNYLKQYIELVPILLLTLPWWIILTQIFVVYPVFLVELGATNAQVSFSFSVLGTGSVVMTFLGAFFLKKLPLHAKLFASYVLLFLVLVLMGAASNMATALVASFIFGLPEAMLITSAFWIVGALSKKGMQSATSAVMSINWGIGSGIGAIFGYYYESTITNYNIWYVFAAIALASGFACLFYRPRMYRDLSEGLML